MSQFFKKLESPWKDNPMKKENFYKLDESFESKPVHKKSIRIDARGKKTVSKKLNESSNKIIVKKKDAYSDLFDGLR